jgi:uridine kinase
LKTAKPKLIAIVGGSGSGKTWLANNLSKVFRHDAARLSLDDFYRDRSHLSEARQKKINFDHPRAIDWKDLERVLSEFAKGHAAETPRYDFTTHSRSPNGKLIKPKPLIIMDGLWLLRRRAVRRFFCCGIFIDCPKDVCLQRRINRDSTERGRNMNDVRKQFLKHVLPMQNRFVASQSRWANVVLRQPGAAEITTLVARLKTILKQNTL